MLYYNARYYDPAIGRFISADSVVPNPVNPQDFNRYAYVNNNPIGFTDPSGHTRMCGAVSGGACFSYDGPAVGGMGDALKIAGGAVIVYSLASRYKPGATPPATTDQGGNTAGPSGLDPNDPLNLEDLVRNKGSVEIREKTQQGTGKGDAYEKFLKDTLRGSRGFEARTTGSGNYRDFDGSYGNGSVWYEAKDQVWSTRAINDFMSKAGEQLKAARAAGSEFELISSQEIPEALQEWMLKKGIRFRVLPMSS